MSLSTGVYMLVRTSNVIEKIFFLFVTGEGTVFKRDLKVLIRLFLF